MDKKLRIIGLAGTNGSGKDTVGHILADNYGYLFVSVTDILREEALRRKIEPNRENLRLISAEWRRQTSRPGVLVDKALDKFNRPGNEYKGLVMASMRHPGEADRIHELGGTMVWVDADPHVRYDRIQANAATRGRAAEDAMTFEQFLSDETIEMSQSGDEATLNLSAVKARCDVFLDNDSDDLEVLRLKIRDFLRPGAAGAALEQAEDHI
jgi:cytidylate kinase